MKIFIDIVKIGHFYSCLPIGFAPFFFIKNFKYLFSDLKIEVYIYMYNKCSPAK